MIEYRNINVGELNRSLFSSFIRRQEVIKCVRRENGAWVVRDNPFIDDWSEEDYQFLIKCLKHTVSSGGFLQGAFADGQLKGFVSIEPELFGGENKYLDLSSLHVSADFRGKGIGTALFDAAKEFAKQSGAKKLYISSHSAIETQTFYRKMGCVDAAEPNEKHVAKEPFDRQLECSIK